MTAAHDEALVYMAANAYTAMLRALLSAMRTYQRNDEPARAGTAPAVIALALAYVLAVRMADMPGALDLAEEMMATALDLQRGVVPAGDGYEKTLEVLHRMEEGGLI